MQFRVIIDVHCENHTNGKFTVWTKYGVLLLNLVVHVVTSVVLKG
jgi:uracil DNA glycosylase